MISLRPDQVQSILCIGAHADDIEIGCGGTLLKLLSERTDIDVHWVVLSGNETRTAEAKSCAKRFLAGAARSTVDVQSFQDASFPYADPMGLKDYFRQLSRS
ncbi:MAG: PIG-L family deacetylase, partial [Rhizobiales bacterium]|nr:PIG-L family deacetylase [Hyphomicrobiales bacterium]